MDRCKGCEAPQDACLVCAQSLRRQASIARHATDKVRLRAEKAERERDMSKEKIVHLEGDVTALHRGQWAPGREEARTGMCEEHDTHAAPNDLRARVMKAESHIVYLRGCLKGFLDRAEKAERDRHEAAKRAENAEKKLSAVRTLATSTARARDNAQAFYEGQSDRADDLQEVLDRVKKERDDALEQAKNTNGYKSAARWRGRFEVAENELKEAVERTEKAERERSELQRTSGIIERASCDMIVRLTEERDNAQANAQGFRVQAEEFHDQARRAEDKLHALDTTEHSEAVQGVLDAAEILETQNPKSSGLAGAVCSAVRSMKKRSTFSGVTNTTQQSEAVQGEAAWRERALVAEKALEEKSAILYDEMKQVLQMAFHELCQRSRVDFRTALLDRICDTLGRPRRAPGKVV